MYLRIVLSSKNKIVDVLLFYLSGVEKLVGLDGCIKRFKLGHREVKIQSASEPLALRRISLNECQSGGGSLEEAVPSSSASSFKRDLCRDFSCQNGGVCLSFGATAKCQCKKYVKKGNFFPTKTSFNFQSPTLEENFFSKDVHLFVKMKFLLDNDNFWQCCQL